jgi:hypothetical protein
MSTLNSNKPNFTGVELINLTSKKHKGGDESGRNDRVRNLRPSRENGQWFACDFFEAQVHREPRVFGNRIGGREAAKPRRY